MTTEQDRRSGADERRPQPRGGPGPRASVAIPPPRRPPGRRASDRDDAGRGTRHEHRCDELSPAQARVRRARRGGAGWVGARAALEAATDMHTWFASMAGDDPDTRAAADWLTGESLRRFGALADAWQRATVGLAGRLAGRSRHVRLRPRPLAGSAPGAVQRTPRRHRTRDADRARRRPSTGVPVPPRTAGDEGDDPMTPLTASALRWRYLVLVALRWLPVGLLVPDLRPVGARPRPQPCRARRRRLAPGLRRPGPRAADRRTRGHGGSQARAPRRVGRGASPRSRCWSSRTTFAAFAVAFLLQGVYRALDSGPLEAWFVDETLAVDPESPDGRRPQRCRRGPWRRDRRRRTAERRPRRRRTDPGHRPTDRAAHRRPGPPGRGPRRHRRPHDRDASGGRATARVRRCGRCPASSATGSDCFGGPES